MTHKPDPQLLQQTIELQQNEIQKLEQQLMLKEGALRLLSHDIRNISNNLAWVLNSLQNKEVPQDILFKMLPELQAEVTINQTAIQNVLHWIKHTDESAVHKTDDFSLNSLCTELIARVNGLAKEKNLQISLTIPPSLIIKTDRYLLSFVLMRILENAIKYSFVGGLIQLYIISADDHSVELCIEDAGVGIEDLEQLFTFEGTRYTGTGEEKGAGFSLVVASEICKSLGITIRVSSEPHNTKFILQIPKFTG